MVYKKCAKVETKHQRPNPKSTHPTKPSLNHATYYAAETRAKTLQKKRRQMVDTQDIVRLCYVERTNYVNCRCVRFEGLGVRR
jgi:hypothetical protein